MKHRAQMGSLELGGEKADDVGRWDCLVEPVQLEVADDTDGTPVKAVPATCTCRFAGVDLARRAVAAQSIPRLSQWGLGSWPTWLRNAWREWRLPGDGPQAYAVYVDDRESLWLSDFGANSLFRFDAASEAFTSYALPDRPGNIRQILGRPGEVWGAESAADALVRLRT